MKLATTLIGLLLLNPTALTVMARKTDDDPKSKAESTGYEETSRYQDVLRFIGELQKRTDKLRVESFGKSEEGRDLPLLIFSDPPVSQPREAMASGKPRILIMANIHAGEVEGKEAVLHLSRRIASGDLRPLLKNLTILIAPIYNADGNEKISPNNRTAQNGPLAGVGTRENANRMDLNRDYMKLESAEANALINLFNRWDPHLTVDLHTTNGSYHGYHLTFSPTLNPNADARLIAFERNRMLPAIRTDLLKRHQFRTYFYGNFATREALGRELNTFREPKPGENPTRVWRTFDHRPMFGNNYVGLRNRLTILSEAYSYLDFRGRVAVTEAFVEGIFNYASAHAREIVDLIKRVDHDAILGKFASMGVDFELKALDKPVEILIGEVKKVRNPRSGKDMTAMIEDKFTPASMVDFGLFTASKSAPVPRAYLFRHEEGLATVTAKLLAHGVAVEELVEPLSTEAESFVIDSVSKAARVFQGHEEVRIKGHFQTEPASFPAGSILIRTSQPLAPLIFYLLEPESDNGFVNWNFLDAYLEKGKTYPIYKLSGEIKANSRLLIRRNRQD